MGDEKWNFRRQENNFDDSSSDDPDSNSTQVPLIHNPDLVLDSNQIYNGTETVNREQPAKTCKRRCKKDDSKPEKVKQVRKRKPKNVCVEEKDDVGMFMQTLLDDLTASRQSLMDWMKTELYGSDLKVESRPVAAQRSVKTRRTKKKKVVEEEKTEINKSKEIVKNNQELDCNGGPLDMEKEKNVVVTNPKSVVLAIKAPNLSQEQKRTREANNIKKRSSSSMVETIGSKTQKDHNFMIPIAPKQPSPPSSLMQSIPVNSSLLFPSSNQGITSLASNNNFQLRQPPEVSHIPEFQTGFTGSSLFNNNGYFSTFPTDFQPNLIAGGYNFPAQLNPLTSSQQRDNNNMFGGGLRMAGGAIRFSGNMFPETEAGDSFHDYRTSFGR